MTDPSQPEAAGSLRYYENGVWQTKPLEQPSTSVGRSEDQDIVIKDQKVSRNHAALLREAKAYWVVDQKSTRGTFLNGKPIERALLKHGDTLQFGSATGLQMTFHDRGKNAESFEATSFHELFSIHNTLLPKENEKTARQMEQLNWLLSAARQLNQGSAVQEIVRVLLELTLQLTGVERGFVFLCEENQLRFVLGLNCQGGSLTDDGTISRRAVDKAIASEARFSISDTAEDMVASEWLSVVANQIRTIYCIPFRSRASGDTPSKLLGLVYLDGRKTGANLSSIDHQLLDAIATESAALVQNAMMAAAEQQARRAQQELAVAARIHSGLMSFALPALPYATMHARSIPCLEIGGDFYDAVAMPDAVSMVIVDVSGKGVSSAIVAATLQGIIHAQFLAGQPLPAIAAMVNRFLCSRSVGKYATMVLLRLFPDGRFEYLNCGHIAPVLLRNNDLRKLPETNLVVGLIDGASYESTWDSIQPGERLLLMTDGVTEAEDAQGRDFSDAELYRILPSTNLEGLLSALATFQGSHPAQDDCTLIEVQFQP